VDSQVRVLEQVRGLRVDLERVLPIEQVQVEPVVGHHLSVLQPNTERRARADRPHRSPIPCCQTDAGRDGPSACSPESVRVVVSVSATFDYSVDRYSSARVTP